jgi:hypothetical protein
MRPQQAEKLQLQIDALEAGIETVSMQIRELKNHASQPQLYTWRKHIKNLKAKLAVKRLELKESNPTLLSINRNTHA